MQSWLSDDSIPLGSDIHLFMEWEVKATGENPSSLWWPEPLSPFVHLRKVDQDGGETTITQQDGPPRWFHLYSPGGAVDAFPDWRQLSLQDVESPTGAGELSAELRVVVGLYNPTSGERAAVLDEQGNVVGNEVVIGHIQVEEANVADFACAMNPPTCASQPLQ